MTNALRKSYKSFSFLFMLNWDATFCFSAPPPWRWLDGAYVISL